MNTRTLELVGGLDSEVKNLLNGIFATQRTFIRMHSADGPFKGQCGVPEPFSLTVRYTEDDEEPTEGPFVELEAMFYRLASMVKLFTRGKGGVSDAVMFISKMKEIMARKLPNVVMTSLLDEKQLAEDGTYRIVLSFATDDQNTKIVFTDRQFDIETNNPRKMKVWMQTTRGALNISV